MNFFYFSNNNKIIKALDLIKKIDTLFIDLEIIGKKIRQANTNSLISEHSFDDISRVNKFMRNTILGARINPINSNSKYEINECINRGAKVLMLPMFKSADEVLKCLDYINGRSKLDLLFETPESLINIKEFPLDQIRYVHFGINDIALALKYKNMFECFISGVLDGPTNYLKIKNKKFGIGGIGSFDAKPIPPKLILEMHKYYSSSRIILSRSFLNKIDLKSSEDSMLSSELQFNLLDKLISSIMSQEVNNTENIKLDLQKFF